MTTGPAVTLPEGVSGDLLLLFVGLFLLFLAVALIALILLGRRRHAEEVREVVVALEEMRSGRLRHRPDIGRRSAMALVADSVQRLGQDVAIQAGELERSRERIAVLEQAVPDTAIITTDQDGSVRTVNGNACDLFGWRPGDVLAQPASVLFEESFWKDLLPRLARKSLRESGIRLQGDMVRSDGTPFRADLTVRLLKTGDAGHGQASGFVLVIRDVAEREQLAAKLQAAEEQQDLLMEGIADGVAILVDGEIVHANRALAAMVGNSPGELQGQRFLNMVATTDLLQARERLASIAGEGGEPAEPFRLDLRREEGDGGSTVLFKGSPVRYRGRAAILAICRDMTGQARFEEELRRNEARLDAVLESAREGILVLLETPEGPVVHLTNRAFLELFDLDQREVLGAPEGTVLRLLRSGGERGAAVAAFLAAAHREPAGETVEGDPEVELAATPLTDRRGRYLGRMLRCMQAGARGAAAGGRLTPELEADVNSIRESCRQLDRTNAELRKKTAELESYNDELLKLDEMKTRLLGNVSHELQTPLVSIRGYTEMILKGRLGTITEEQERGLSLSLKNIDRLIAMIDGLLNLARSDRLHLTVFPLVRLVEEAEELIRPKLSDKDLSLAIRHEAPDIRVQGDREKLFQVFVNLLSNAVKYNRPGGRIELLSRAGDAGTVAVEVRDTGIGIAPEARRKIFDRFYRAEPEEGGEERGSGIGLSIVHNILRLHGCSIHVESVPGSGSTFSFTLPRAEDEAPAAEDGGQDGGAGAEGRPRLRIIRRSKPGNAGGPGF